MKLICENCKRPFTYREILKNNFRLESFKITCPKCFQVHMVKPYRRLLAMILYTTPLFISYLIFLENNYNIGLFLLVAIGLYFISSFITPFVYRIKKIKDNN